MNLTDHWVIGFSGNRRLENPETVRIALRAALQDLQKLAPARFIAISSVAMGADLLFVEEATKVGIPWICVLPFPEDAFFNEKDFPDPIERQTARQKILEAADHEIVRFPRTAADLRDPTWRQAAFAETGFRGVEEADVFIAVFHETTEPPKTGGTRDIVSYARARNRTLLIIDAQTGHMRWENGPVQLLDPLTEELRRLKNGTLKSDERSELPTPAAITMAMWRNGFARAARKHMPGIRWGTSLVVILHALATIIAATVFLLLHPVNLDLPSGALRGPSWANNVSLLKGLEVSAFVFVLIGFCFLLWLLCKRPQLHAANYRFAAEIGRSVLATWSIPGAAAQIIRGLPLEFTHFARNLRLHHRFDPDRRREVPNETFGETDVQSLAAAYIAGRIKAQIKYYSDKYDRSKCVARALEVGSILFSCVAVVSAGFLAFSHPAELHRALWGLAKLAAATAAPITVSLLVIHEVKRREARYHEMEQSLQQYEQRIGQVRSVSALQDLVTDVERMLLGESYEWWILAKQNVAA